MCRSMLSGMRKARSLGDPIKKLATDKDGHQSRVALSADRNNEMNWPRKSHHTCFCTLYGNVRNGSMFAALRKTRAD